jgi:hypothetical protein
MTKVVELPKKIESMDYIAVLENQIKLLEKAQAKTTDIGTIIMISQEIRFAVQTIHNMLMGWDEE